MPRHTKAEQAKNKRDILRKLRKQSGAAATAGELAILRAKQRRATTPRKKTVSGMARNAAASNASRRARRRGTFK